MECKATDNCDNKAEYVFQGINTCLDCLSEHIRNELMDEAIGDYIDMNADKLTNAGDDAK